MDPSDSLSPLGDGKYTSYIVHHHVKQNSRRGNGRIPGPHPRESARQVLQLEVIGGFCTIVIMSLRTTVTVHI